jgi:hypothetical protein
LQWYSWALADDWPQASSSVSLAVIPDVLVYPRSLDGFGLWMALNSAIWAVSVGILVTWAQHRRRRDR